MSVITFDATFYLAQNPDVAAAVAAGTIPSAQFHFEQFGQFELRDPNEFFDSDYYLTTNTDVLAAVQRGEFTSGFQHFVLNGQAEGVGRSPNAAFEGFNEASYLAANPDVAAAVAAGSFANGFQHFVQFGVNEPRPGTGLDESSQLGTQLEALAAAEVAVDDALEDAALALNAEGYLESDGSVRPTPGTPLTGADLSTGLAGFDEGDFGAALAQVNGLVTGAQVGVANAQIILDDARRVESDAALQRELTSATTQVNADADAQALVQDRNTAVTALANDVTADGSNEAVVTDLGVAIGAFLGTGGAAGTVILRGPAPGTPETTVGALQTLISAALAETDEAAREAAFDAIVDTFGGTGSLTLETGTGGSAASRTALTTELSVVEQRGDLEIAVEEAEADIAAAILIPGATSDALVRFVDAEDAIEFREGLIEDVATAQEALAEVLELRAALQPGVDTIDARDALGEAIEIAFGPLVDVDGAEVATAEDDIFVADTEATGALSITGFDDAGDDVLFVGRGFTLVDLADGSGIPAGGAGNVNALEIFVQQDGADTVLFIEERAFDGSVGGTFGGTAITLVGVDAGEVTLDANGFITLTPEAAALVA